MPRRGHYLFRRRNSQNWWLRLQYPGELRSTAELVLGRKVGPKIERSLGTPDRREAEVIAASEILEHKKILLLHAALNDPARCQGRIVKQFQMEPGQEVIRPDGTKTVATNAELVHFDADGCMLNYEPNFVGHVFELDESVISSAQKREINELKARTKRAIYKDVDSEIVENWIKLKNPARTHELTARNMLALFKEVTGGKTFSSASRADAQKVVDALQATGNTSVTIKTKLSGISAAIYLEMKDEKNARVKHNPFSGIAQPNDNDRTDRLPLDEADMALMRENLHLLGAEERLMWVWCATSGMRPKEVYNILEEFTEGGNYAIRYVWIRKSKNNASTRKLPISEAVLPLLPGKIEGSLFKQKLYNILIHINGVMQKLGISNRDPDNGRERKVAYSLRHRAKDRLLYEHCPEDIRRAILGHVKTVHDRYGQGYMMWQIKPWIEKIGW